MGQTKEGAEKYRKTMRERYGVDKDGKSLHHKTAGKRSGGRSEHGFQAMPFDKVSQAGKKGAKARWKKVKEAKQTNETKDPLRGSEGE